jgi:hypothetical protein
MSDETPQVSAEFAIRAFQQIADDHEAYGSTEPTISIVRAFHGTHSADELSNVSYRLGALAKFIREGKGGKWTIPVLYEDHTLINEALIRAAARAPLFAACTVGEVSFEPESFLAVFLEESEAEGNG